MATITAARPVEFRTTADGPALERCPNCRQRLPGNLGADALKSRVWDGP